MTTMLERAARAIHASDQARDPIVPDWEWVSQDAYISMARAVLMAVRDGSCVHDHEDGRANFTVMIDAILNEERGR